MRRRSAYASLVALLGAALIAGCGGAKGASPNPGDGTTEPGPTTVESTGPATKPSRERPLALLPRPSAVPVPTAAQLTGVAVRWERAPASVPAATGLVWNVRVGAFYAIGQDGYVYRLDRDLRTVTKVLDIAAEVSPYTFGSERGLLGIEFGPRDGRLFLHYTDRDYDSHVASWAMMNGVPVPGSRREVLFQKQPGLAHKAGQLAFDDQGNLYVALGDGNRAGMAQDESSLLGSILRVRPKPGGPGYTIPAGNPFAGRADANPAVFAKGLRNPWRFSIDRATGDIWIGDVGESTIEEVDRIPAGTSGQNFGWPSFEGSQRVGDGDGAFVEPVTEYRHDEIGPAVIAGFVYHGRRIPGLRGAFVFGDMSGPMFALGRDGRVRLRLTGIGGVMSTMAQGPSYEIIGVSQREGMYRLVPA